MCLNDNTYVRWTHVYLNSSFQENRNVVLQNQIVTANCNKKLVNLNIKNFIHSLWFFGTGYNPKNYFPVWWFDNLQVQLFLYVFPN